MADTVVPPRCEGRGLHPGLHRIFLLLACVCFEFVPEYVLFCFVFWGGGEGGVSGRDMNWQLFPMTASWDGLQRDAHTPSAQTERLKVERQFLS